MRATGCTPELIFTSGDADFNVVHVSRNRPDRLRSWLQARVRPAMYKDRPDRGWRNQGLHRRSGRDHRRGRIARAARQELSRLPWYSRSVDSNYLTGKRVFIFADATHAMAAARFVAETELGFKVVGLGTYTREFAREVREEAERVWPRGVDYRGSPRRRGRPFRKQQPELVLGTQMERHIAKRLRIGCAVISAPVHVQDFPARYSPQMGFEGANVIFDSWVHPLTMGLEEHLLGMFRDDFEFSDDAVPSHLASEGEPRAHAAAAAQAQPTESVGWDTAAEKELKKIPFFVRGKARRNTESFAAERGIACITVETLYEAKAHYAR
jgi:light-independent protochlorophyllide reductase subunit B